MTPSTTSSALRSRALLSAAFLGAALFGTSVSQAQEPASAQQAEVVSQNADAMRGIEKSDIRRGQARVGDVDGDGFGDPAPVARQADLKKLADELVNAHGLADGTGGHSNPSAATQGNSGNALNVRSMNGRAGDPIPDIDITVNQSPGGSSIQSSDASDQTSESIPALDPNPSL